MMGEAFPDTISRSVDALDGPAKWSAIVVDGLVVEWRVDDIG